MASSMNSASKAWIVAASIGAVEALKDQLGVCRWNYTMRSLHQHAKNNIRSYHQAKKLSGPSAAPAAIEKAKQQSKQASVTKIMDLNCWGPNTTRF